MYPYERYVHQCKTLTEHWQGDLLAEQLDKAKIKMAEEVSDDFRNLVMTPINNCNNCGLENSIFQPEDYECIYDIYPQYTFPMIKYGVTICTRCYDAYYEEIVKQITRKALFYFIPGILHNKNSESIVVKRSNGIIENDWSLSNSVMNYKDKKVLVRKNDHVISKSISLDELYELNPNVNFYFRNFPNAFVAVDFAMFMRICGKKELIELKNKILENIRSDEKEKES
jgi:hypothetical protein